MDNGFYNHNKIEKKWQNHWESNKTFKSSEPISIDPTSTYNATKPKYYVLDMFPYPSGQGLHVGHPEGYTASDIIARYKRMKGFNVLHPIGWDAFGLPAEQYAIQTGTHPAQTTQKNIDNMRRQVKSLGFSYDWDRQVDTTDPNYYKWTQWIFLKFYNCYFDENEQKAKPIAQLPIPQGLTDDEIRKYIDDHRLAYESFAPVNWCPALGTVLANEEVIGGLSERGSHPVFRKPMRQWMLRITKYCERLLEGLEEVDWPDSIKKLQTDWIGKSIGAEVDFKIDGFDDKIRVFTTRPDTLFGATYMVMAPEHALVDQITTDEHKEAVNTYREEAARKSDLDRTDLAKDKSGQFTGAYAINPVNSQKIPIWISDYVLISYGTGAIMAVPAHDERDFEFATKFELPVRVVVADESILNAPEFTQQAVYENLGNPEFAYYHHDEHGQPDAPDAYSRYFKQSNFDPTWIKPIETQGNGTAFLRRFSCPQEPFPARIDLDLIQVDLSSAWVAKGIAVNSEEFTGLPTVEFKVKIAEWLEEKGLGKAAVNYKLRDWLFSRQRYWGEPFPIVHTENEGTVGLSEDDLPLRLPEVADYKPSGTGEPPLSNAGDWLNTQGYVKNGMWYVYDDEKDVEFVVPPNVPMSAKEIADNPNAPLPHEAGGISIGDDGIREIAEKIKGTRETNTMPQWAGSCWYYLRYMDPDNAEAAFDKAKEEYWMPVDLYIGGAEHAVLHLLYSRFWHKLLYDLGYVTCQEPFKKLINQGMILGGDGQKMSKSRGNVINPDVVIDDHGADSMRLYEMFMGPLEATKPWNMQGVEGVHRFLNKAWRMIIDEDSGEVCSEVQDAKADEATTRLLHQTIKKVGGDIDTFGFNTAISQMMIFVNHGGKLKVRPKDAVEKFVLVLAPFAPHIAEELWQRLGHTETLAYETWPSYDEELVKEKEVELAVQVLGKIKDKIVVAADATEEAIKEKALASEKVQAAMGGKEPKKVIVIKSRLVNIVV